MLFILGFILLNILFCHRVAWTIALLELGVILIILLPLIHLVILLIHVFLILSILLTLPLVLIGCLPLLLVLLSFSIRYYERRWVWFLSVLFISIMKEFFIRVYLQFLLLKWLLRHCFWNILYFLIFFTLLNLVFHFLQWVSLILPLFKILLFFLFFNFLLFLLLNEFILPLNSCLLLPFTLFLEHVID